MALDRRAMACEIVARLEEKFADVVDTWQETEPARYFVVDDLLPEQWALKIRAAFPEPQRMTLKRSLRELKYVGAQMDQYHPLLEESIYAFQAPAVVELIGKVTGLPALEPDGMLYAGGVSLMGPGHFLNPHIDNSHDRTVQRYRALNLLYYVSPGWSEHCGGNLELWPQGPRGEQRTITSRFNRLVVMLTHRRSWHSVSRNVSASDRCCVSNYYFSKRPLDGADYYHVTEFRGRPEQPVRDLALRADNWLRTLIRTKLPGAFKNRHFYNRAAAAGQTGSQIEIDK